MEETTRFILICIGIALGGGVLCLITRFWDGFELIAAIVGIVSGIALIVSLWLGVLYPYALWGVVGAIGFLTVFVVDTLQRRPGTIIAGLVATTAAIGVALLCFSLWMGGTWFGGSEATAQGLVANTESPAPIEGCDDTGSGEWELQDLHGDGGRLVNGGADNILEVLAVAAHDPLVLRTFYLDLVSPSEAQRTGDPYVLARSNQEEKVPSVDDLKCVENRKQMYNQLLGILNVSTTENRIMSDVAADYGLPVENGQVRAQNVAVSGDEVGVGVSNINPAEEVITVTMPNGAKSNHRTYCANALIPGPVPPPGKGGLIVVKTDDGKNTQGIDLPVPGFHIVVDGPTDTEGDTDGSGVVEFDDLEPGKYQVSEINQPGWEPVLPASVSVKVGADQVVYARFKNRQVPLTPTPTDTPLKPGETPKPTKTNTPTDTPEPGATRTKTPTSTNTNTPTRTNTPKPPCREDCEPSTSTNTPTNTPTDTPTTTPTPENTPTRPAPCCPTAVNTPPREGGTPVISTFTPTNTRTPVPHTPTPERTSIPSTNTPVSVWD